MIRPAFTLARVAVAACGLALLVAAPAQDPASRPTSREAMWPAASAEDWKRPCLVQFQRTWEDALALQRQTTRPILVCVNMDGEIASEHYAGVRYRQPEIAALYAPYVCVIASVYRHTPRDHDEQGRRILCPRFGSVTCGEHIALEPIMFEKFLGGRRIAPRHICVEPDGTKTYDVFYAWDTDSVFKAVRDGAANRTLPPSVVKGDRSLAERVASPDNKDRSAVEQSFLQGDENQKKALLDAAVATGDKASADLLRLAVFGVDVDASRLARRALTQATAPAAVDVISEALRVPMDATERDALIATLARLGDASPRARTLAVVHQGLAHESTVVDVSGWSKVLTDGAPGAVDSKPVVAPAGSPEAIAELERAESYLASARGPRQERRFVRALFTDAHAAGVKAEKLGATGWRVNAAIGVAAFHLGLRTEAQQRAEAAVAAMPADPEGWSAMAVLGLFAEARQTAIAAAVRDKKDWPAQWLADVHAAYAVLARHPLGDDTQVQAHYDFLKWLGAAGQAARVLDDGLTRFPDSIVLHQRLRGRLLEEKGIDGLETAYDAMLRAPGATPQLEWFAGHASFLAAENHRRAAHPALGIAAYDRAIAHYERSIKGDSELQAAADTGVALALAGRARIALEARDDAHAVTDMLASLARRPEAAADRDGLNLSPVDTAKMLLARLHSTNQTASASQLDAALAKLDPGMLALPAFERDPNGGAPSPASRPARPRTP